MHFGYKFAYESNAKSSGNTECPHKNFTNLNKHKFRMGPHNLRAFLACGKVTQSLLLFITICYLIQYSLVLHLEIFIFCLLLFTTCIY